MTAPLYTLSIGELAPKLESRSVTATAVVEACLARISERDPELNGFITVMSHAARRAARTVDEEIAAGRYRGPLHGVPIAIKDLIDTRGTPTTAASRVRSTAPVAHDAPIVQRLRHAGAVLLGKCNLHEFAFGTTSEDSAFGPTRHPYDVHRSPGGSSGGSAVAVVTGMSFGSIGTDTGGSIRIPAAACGAVGLKPAYGELPCDGIVPLSRSLDHVGPLARTVSDVWILYRCLAGDPRPVPLTKATLAQPDTRVLGIPEAYFLDRLDPAIRQLFAEAIDRLRAAGCRIERVDIPHAEAIPATYLHVVMPEAFAYHARTLEARPEDYTPGVRLRLQMGHYIMAEDYVRAQHGRDVLRREVDAALHTRHALILPTLPIPAPLLGASTVAVGEAVESVRSATLRLTQLFNLTGHPAVSIPCGVTADGLPGGLQLVGQTNGTADLVKLAAQLEPLVTVDARSGADA